MGDALDDLFGAFDEEPVRDKPEEKKRKLEIDAADSVLVQDVTDDDDVDDRRTSLDAAIASKDTKSVYSAVMNRQLATTELDISADKEANKSNNSSNQQHQTKDQLRGSGEISTGISHDKSVRSYTAYPKNLPVGHVPVPVPTPKEPWKTYSFKLDPFQAQAVGYIDKEESVLVAAHTSAG
jgi:ATP-dependent RNA helicase DOB1